MFFTNNINTKWVLAVVWVIFLAALAYWLELGTRNKEKEKALVTARAFFHQVLITRQWNALHGGVFAQITETTQPNKYLGPQGRDLTADNGIKLTKINPAYMTRQIAELAEKDAEGIQFHITSLNPIRPENVATELEKKWLKSFEQGSKEQGEFFKEGEVSWFRYMAPLAVESECLKCHAQQGYKEGDIRGGISVSIPYAVHGHLNLILGYGSVAFLGLMVIFIGANYIERKQRLFDATFNSPVPSCIMDLDFKILIGNESYWATFGPLSDEREEIKCYEHRPTILCHTEDCPIAKIRSGASGYTLDAVVEIKGVARHFLDTVKPFYDKKNKLIGCVESLQEITDLKKIERELEASNRKLAALSTTDGLTKIANRRLFDEVLAHEYARHIRSGEKFSLIMLDIDYFKKFNDHYGHVDGDKCLQRIAQILADYANRPADLPARYGGEEFACILPATDHAGAVAVAEKIRQSIFDCAIPHQESSIAPYVTASLGVVTVLCTANKSAEYVIEQADELLYRAKALGRNRVEALGPEEMEDDGKGDLIRLIWKDYYCCGDPLIDSQHKSLFDISNRLFEAIFANRSDVEVAGIIRQMLDDVRQHFQDEEKILADIGFSGLQQHAEKHAKLLEKGIELSQMFTDSKLLIGDVIQYLVSEVAMDHMIKEDRKYFQFIS